MSGRKSPPRKTIIFLTCLLAVPTLHSILYPAPHPIVLRTYLPHLAVGALLGGCHLILRPLLRVLSAPLGCLTLGLVGAAIDIALIYLCAALVQGFTVPSFLFAVLSAMTTNFICALAGGRKH